MTISIKPTASGSTIEQDGSTILTVDGSGNITPSNNLYPKVTSFKATASTTQNFTSSTFTKIILGNESWDTNSNFDNTTNYRFTPTIAGYYQVNGSYSFQGTPNPGYTLIACIYKNGSEHIRGAEMYSITTTFNQANVSGMVYLNGTTDYIELYVVGIGGSTSTGELNFSFMDAHLVSV